MRGHPRPRHGDVYSGTFVNLRDTTSAEIAASTGFDVVFVDLEHSVVPYGPADFVRAVEVGGASAWLRADATTPVQPWLDAGVRGVLFSRCSSASDAQQMVERVAWPPLGARGLAGSERAGGYGSRDPDFATPAPAASIGVVIEDRAGVEDADGILSSPGIDLVVVGLNDLAVALATDQHRSASDLADRVTACMEHVAKVASANRVAIAVPLAHPVLTAATRALSFRPDMYLAGSDVKAIARSLASALAAVHQAADQAPAGTL